jgi:hypothetical protein
MNKKYKNIGRQKTHSGYSKGWYSLKFSFQSFYCFLHFSWYFSLTISIIIIICFYKLIINYIREDANGKQIHKSIEGTFVNFGVYGQSFLTMVTQKKLISLQTYRTEPLNSTLHHCWWKTYFTNHTFSLHPHWGTYTHKWRLSKCRILS